jgi:glycine/D-amino acid oxidase-like deaminating enzyme
MTAMKLDYLIVGQGLAGSLLAWQLMARGQRVLVIDNDHAHASSTVAAGLINPVTGKRLVKSAGVDACLPVARAYYRALESLLGETLLVEKPMLRLFHRLQERERWRQRQQEPGYKAYLGEVVEAAQLPPPIYAGHGAGRQLQTAYLRTTPLLHGLRDWLREQHSYLQAELDYAELQLQAQGVTWRDYTARRVIFCEGYQGMHNPWFGRLPFQPAKGEFLTVSSSMALPDLIINSGRWIMPRGDGRYRVGASYDHQPLDELITTASRQMLLAALPAFLHPAPVFTVLGQQAGVRPTTSDRQPFIGIHPQQPQLAIFNGFGSKGSLLIPWHVERLVERLLEQRPLPAQIDIARYQESLDG